VGNTFLRVTRIWLLAGVLLLALVWPAPSWSGARIQGGRSSATGSQTEADFAYVIAVDVAGVEGNTLELHLSLQYWGPNVPVGGDLSETSVQLLGTDSPRVINEKITDAVQADAALLGYSVVPRSMIIPAFRKGT
jgi:hypothetical protein